MNIRNIALDNVISVLEDKKPFHIVMKASLKGVEDPRDRSFIMKLTKGCIERAITLDFLTDKLSSVKVKKQKTVIRNILRCGMYQIFFMDGVADFAACDESVKLAVKRGFGSLKGFVNGVLRNGCRKKEELLLSIKDDISINYSMPGWITEDFVKRFGKERTGECFGFFLESSPVPVRVSSKVSAEGVEDIIRHLNGEEGVTAEKNPYIDHCFSLKDAGSVEDIKEFNEGTITVQDFSSVLVGYTADRIYRKLSGNAAGRAKVLDLCAAPGGKSLHLADLGYDVTSCDISEIKLKLIKEAANRLKVSDIRIFVNDATVFNKDLENGFDIVISDLPCSGLGVIGKKPDIKYNMTSEKSSELAKLQKEILTNAVRYLKKGGLLVFSTCTVRKCENEENAVFITEKLGLKGIPVREGLPKGIEPEKEDDDHIQILPGEYGGDGFFICTKVKTDGI